MIEKQMRILTMVSCRRMHDHGAVSVKWIYEGDDPFALTLWPEGTDQSWQVDRLEFCEQLLQLVPGEPRECGVASMQLRQSNPFALSLRLTEYAETGVKHTYLICSLFDVIQFLEMVAQVAPSTYADCGVDDTIAKILTS
jgi:hypothetical protein